MSDLLEQEITEEFEREATVSRLFCAPDLEFDPHDPDLVENLARLAEKAAAAKRILVGNWVSDYLVSKLSGGYGAGSEDAQERIRFLEGHMIAQAHFEQASAIVEQEAGELAGHLSIAYAMLPYRILNGNVYGTTPNPEGGRWLYRCDPRNDMSTYFNRVFVHHEEKRQPAALQDYAQLLHDFDVHDNELREFPSRFLLPSTESLRY